MTTVSSSGGVSIEVTGARGESYADVLRRSGLYGITPSDTDAVAIQKITADIEASTLATSRLYPTTAAGIAATTNGQYFSVPDTDDDFLILYRNNSGVAGEVNRYPSKIALAAMATYTALAAPTGSSLSGFRQLGANAADRTALDKMRERISVDDYRKPIDADDLASFERARDHLISVGGGTMCCGSKTYLLGATFNLTSGSYDIPITIACETGTIIKGTHTGSVIKVGGSMYLRGGGIIGEPTITNTATGGDLIEFGASGCTECNFIVSLEQLNPARRVIYAPVGEVYDSFFGGPRWTVQTTHTVPPVDLIAQGTTINGNRFSPRRVYNAVNSHFFSIRSTDTTTWLVNNVFENITFEVCRGGAIKFSNLRGCTFRNLAFWDAGTYTGHILWGVNNPGYSNVNNMFDNCIRHGDLLATGICDMLFEDVEYSTVINCFNESATLPRYDWNNNKITVVGLLYGEVNTAARTTITGDGLLASGGVVSAQAINGDTSLSLGGINNPERFRMSVGGGFVNNDVLVNSLGQIFAVKDGAGVTTKLVFEATGGTFYPLTDNKTSLGLAPNRFTQIFATNSTINTSDANLKRWRGGMTDAEVAAANDIADGIGVFQWLDALEEKGEAARLHVGVLAQGVIATLEAHGLDPFRYAFVCVDAWDATEEIVTEEVVIPGTPAVLNERGEAVIEGVPDKVTPSEVVVPAREAGVRYGVRLGELSMFIAAAQRQQTVALGSKLSRLLDEMGKRIDALSRSRPLTSAGARHA